MPYWKKLRVKDSKGTANLVDSLARQRPQGAAAQQAAAPGDDGGGKVSAAELEALNAVDSQEHAQTAAARRAWRAVAPTEGGGGKDPAAVWVEGGAADGAVGALTTSSSLASSTDLLKASSFGFPATPLTISTGDTAKVTCIPP